MPGKQTQTSWLLPSPGSTPPSWEHHLSNSPTIHFFTNWEVGAHFLKFFPGPVASFLPSPHLPHQHQWRPPSAALDLALHGGPHPCCAPPHPPTPRLMAELQGFPQPVPRLCAGKKGRIPGATESKLVFVVHSSATSLPGQSISKHRGLGRSPKARGHLIGQRQAVSWQRRTSCQQERKDGDQIIFKVGSGRERDA